MEKSELDILNSGEAIVLSKSISGYKIGDVFYFSSIHRVANTEERMIDLTYNGLETSVMEKFFIEYFDTFRGFRQKKIDNIIE